MGHTKYVPNFMLVSQNAQLNCLASGLYRRGTAAALQIARAKKKSDFVQKAGHFHDLVGRETSGKKAGLSHKKRDGWQVC